MKAKKLIVMCLCAFMLFGCSVKKLHNPSLKIIYGMKPSSFSKINKHYDILVINAATCSKEDIRILHKHARYIYSYLDIAALNQKSNAFSSLKKITLMKTISGKKYYMNVASLKWQSYMQKTIKSYQNKGIDGYFVDHSDLYEKKKTASIYKGLCAIINKIKATKKKIILNNARSFILKDTKILSGIDTITQEDVFTYWDHQKDARVDVSTTQSDILKSYLKKMVALHKHVYVIDFTKKSDWQAVIHAYAKKYGFSVILPKKTDYSKL